jgi:hypothetical protein
MSLPFDATLKAIVAEHPGDFAALFGLPTNEPVTAVNVELSTLTAATDVALAYGQPVRSIIDLNFLWQQPVEAYLNAGVAALPLAALCQMPTGQPLPDALREVVREIERRLGLEASHAEAVRLITATYILTGLRVKKTDLALIYRGVGLMSESTAYDEAIEEGALRLLLRQGRNQFGPDPAAELELKSIHDLDRLDRLADAIFKVKSWQELLSTP